MTTTARLILVVTLVVFGALAALTAQQQSAPPRTLETCEADLQQFQGALLREQREAAVWKARYADVAEQLMTLQAQQKKAAEAAKPDAKPDPPVTPKN